MSINGTPHYTEYMNLSINELSKKFKKHMLRELCYKYDNKSYNTLHKLKKAELVKRLYELLHTEDQSAQESIAIYHSSVDKHLKEIAQQKQERQNKLSEYEEKLDEIQSLMKDADFRELFLNRLQYIIDIEVTPSIHTVW